MSSPSPDPQNAGSGTNTGTSSSISAMVSTLIPVAALAIAYFVVFLILRSKLARVYRPRTFLGTLYNQERTTKLPDASLGWFGAFKSIPDEYVLEHQSLDGYLYLRFLKMITIICFVGALITWPILFPVNATGGAGQKELDLLSFSNINSNGKNRYYAHTFLGWIFFSFVMYIITQETIYFINLRHAYLLAPFNAVRISSRTILFTDVPQEYLQSEKLQQLFGGTFLRFWKVTDTNKLEDDVKERDEVALKLEGAEIKLSQNANKRRLKFEKKNKNVKEKEPHGDEEAAITSRWLEKKDRPTHRVGKIPLIGKKVDTIEWSRSELKKLIPKIKNTQIQHQKDDATLLSAVFVEFISQQAAQSAFRRMSPRKPPKMNPCATQVVPKEIIWKNLKIGTTQRKGRKILANTFITLMIVFWSIPVVVIGAISNINYLVDKLPWLGGEVTFPAVELKTQGWYMAFQVIQVFLITTFSSGAAAVVTQIINEPESATTLLAENLPKASNFYISYFIVQGLGIAAGNILNIGSLAMLTVVGKFLDKSPRKMFNRYITLAGLGWGAMYPKFGNLGVIAITYSIISPLVLGFATIGFALVYLATRYNVLYVLTNNIDTKGVAYAKALQQLMTGVYLAEICLIGLFAINTAPGPIVLMAVFLGFTVVYHILMRQAFKQLTTYLPGSLEGDEQIGLFNTSDEKSYDATKAGAPPSEMAPVTPSGFVATKATLLSKVFDPRKFRSFDSVKTLIPNFPPPRYEEQEEALAYFNPAVRSEVPRLWIVRDEMGISRREVRDSSDVVDISDEYARFNEKGKIIWDTELVDKENGDVANLENVPVWEKRIDY
ncbi:hypothetical protein B0O99DRAFT_561765 [Bisporella sp. PMI_857]|nr:hypothetical protein B0O99DRAFT_561765 [Bisporella sp. PMI_857]